MNWNHVEGTWSELKGRAKRYWGQYTDDDLQIVEGERDVLVGKLQRAYGYAKDQAEREADRITEIFIEGNSELSNRA